MKAHRTAWIPLSLSAFIVVGAALLLHKLYLIHESNSSVPQPQSARIILVEKVVVGDYHMCILRDTKTGDEYMSFNHGLIRLQ